MKSLNFSKTLKLSLWINVLFIFTLLMLLPSAGAQGAQNSFTKVKRGKEAVDAFKERLPKIASKYGKKSEKLKETLLHDKDLWLDPAENLLYLCSFDASEAETLPDPAEAAIPTGPFPLDQTFQLHSLPGASRVIYLDFDGHVTAGTYWNSNFNGGADIVSVPYDFNGNTGSFSDAELSRIQKIWARVAEDFALYNIDVTTEDPGIEALRRSGSGDQSYGARLVISPSSSWFGSAGGVAYVGSFDWSSDTPAFVFSNLLGNGYEKYVTDAISHETGHTLGLSHDGTTGGTSYYAGHGSWAPIMGVGYYKALTQWSKGEYAGANNTEDDLAVMLNNGAAYRPDDHGDWIDNATVLAGDTLDASGIIERTGDMDVFGFQAEAGNVSISVEPANLDPNLDILVQIIDDGGNIVNEDDPYNFLPASLDLELPAGTYYILIDGVGTGNPDTGYSDYASLGQYFISGTLSSTQFPPDAPTGLSAAPASSSRINLSWTDNSANENGFSIERSPNGVNSWVEVGFSAANTATYADTGLIMSTTYHYRVSAYNVIGSSGFSNNASATTFDMPPAAPSSLGAAPVSTGQINLNWADNSNNETGFAIERSPNGIDSWIEIATVADNNTAYADTGLASATPFFYRVAAYNLNGDSGFSNTATATTAAVLPESPANLGAVASASDQIDLNWQDNSNNETGFKVERSANGLSGWTQIGMLDANITTSSDIGLNPGTTYFYRIYAYNSVGNSAYSNMADATTDEIPPDAPVELSATIISPEQINLNWLDNADNESGYIVERSLDGINWNDIAALDPNVTNYTDFSPAPNTSNYYRVCAINNAGVSDFSNIAVIPANGVLNLYDFILGSYAGSQDGIGTVTVENDGAAVNLTGNRWQQIGLAYNITPDTVLEFDFISTAEGEIHAIGFDDNLSYSANRTFQLYGSQSWGMQDFNNYSGGGDVQHYRIEIGKFYTGEMQYLFFAMDHDVSNPTGNSVYSNIRVYEDTIPIAPTITSSPNTEAAVDAAYHYDANSIVEATGTETITFSLGFGPGGMSVSSDGLVTWVPGAGQEGIHTVEIIAANDWGSDSQVFNIDVAAAPGIPPTITSSPNTEAAVDAAYHYDANSIVEATGTETITFSLGFGPDGMSVSSDGLVTWVPGAGQEGIHTVEIIAANDWGSDSQVFNIDVAAAPGIPPTITSSPNTEAAVDAAYHYDANSIVEATGTETITFSLGFGPDGMSVSSDGLVTWVPGAGQEGIHTVEIIAANDWGSDSQVFNIDVAAAPGIPPTITSSPNTEAAVDAAYHYDANSIVEATGTETITFSLGFGPDGMSVSSDGLVTWVPGAGQEGIHTVEIIAANDWGSDSQVFNIDVAAAPDYEALNFYDFILGSYAGNQDGIGTVTVENDGAAVNLTGNRWQQIGLAYNITPDTVLEFDFISTAEGEIHAIGFDDNLSYSANRTFQLYGSQSWGMQDFNNYSGGGDVQHYRIEIGKFYTGEMQYLFFAMDHDVSNPTGNSVYSNIRVYEDTIPIAPTITSSPNTEAAVDAAYHYDANSIVEATGTETITFSLGFGPDGMSVSSDGLVTWVPGAGQEGIHTVEIIAANDWGSDSQVFNIDVAAAPDYEALNFYDFILGSYAGSQDGIGTVTVENDGAAVNLTGNRWQQIGLAYNITPDTVLEFDFISTAEGEIHAIGFDENLSYSANRTFQLYGSQSWGMQDFNNYSGGGDVQHYRIEIGKFYTGEMQYLFFAMDHDVSNPTGNSVYSNIRVYEGTN